MYILDCATWNNGRNDMLVLMELPTYSVRLGFWSLGRSVNIAVLVRLGGRSLALFDAANIPLSGVSTACRGRIEYQIVSVTRYFLPFTLHFPIPLPHSLPTPTLPYLPHPPSPKNKQTKKKKNNKAEMILWSLKLCLHQNQYRMVISCKINSNSNQKICFEVAAVVSL